MSDSGTLTVLTPVERGGEAALRTELSALPAGAQSPAAGVAGTHFARWTVISFRDRHERPIEPGHFLLFAAWFDGGPDEYPEALRVGMRGWVDRIWGHCAGYPGSDGAAAFRAFLLEHSIAPSLPFAAYPQATLDEVLDALALRRRLTDFAVRSQSLDSASLRREWMSAFETNSGRSA